jgi:hypothetical protein
MRRIMAIKEKLPAFAGEGKLVVGELLWFGRGLG